MKALVLFDSNFGNTQKVAEVIARGLDAKLVSVKDITEAELTGLDLLVVGSPIIGWKPTEQMTQLLAGLKPGQLTGTKVTAFDTRVQLFIHGDATTKIMKALKNAGGTEVIPSTGFHVKGTEGPLYEGELGKAADWADLIKRGL